MEKVFQLTVSQYIAYKESEEPFYYILGMVDDDEALGRNFGYGDTLAVIKNADLYGIYKNVRKGKITYYLVVSVVGDEMAFTHTVYEVSEEMVECPKCHQMKYKKEMQALSRKDNKTIICDTCGTREAMEDMVKHME